MKPLHANEAHLQHELKRDPFDGGGPLAALDVLVQLVQDRLVEGDPQQGDVTKAMEVGEVRLEVQQKLEGWVRIL